MGQSSPSKYFIILSSNFCRCHFLWVHSLSCFMKILKLWSGSGLRSIILKTKICVLFSCRVNSNWSHIFVTALLFSLFHPFSSGHLTHLSPLLRATLMSFSIPPASLRALVFSMFFVMTSWSAQQIAVMVSSDMVFPTRLLLLTPPLPPLLLLLLLPPGKRCTRSLIAYLPVRCQK